MCDRTILAAVAQRGGLGRAEGIAALARALASALAKYSLTDNFNPLSFLLTLAINAVML